MDKAKILRSSREYIIEAFFILLKSKKIEKISILEVCAKAGVSRVTFYKYFKTKVDIIKEFFRINDLNLNTFIEENKPKDNYKELFTDKYFETIKNNYDKLESLVSNDLEFLLLEQITSSVLKITDNAEENVTYAYVFAGGLFNITIKWINEECKTPTNTISKVIVKSLALFK